MLKKLLAHVKQFKKQSILAPILTALEVLMEILIPYVTAIIIDDGIQAGNLSVVYKYGGLMLGMAFLGLLFGALAGKTASVAATGLGKNLREAMYANIQTFSFSNIDRFSTAGLVTRMTTDVTNIQNAYQMTMRLAIRAPLNFIFSIIMCFFINAHISTIFVVSLLFIAIIAILIMRKVTGMFQRVFHRYDDLNASVQENVSAIRVVKAFVREKFEKRKFGKASDNIYKLFLQVEMIMSGLMPLMMVAIYGVLIVIMWKSAHYIVGGTMAVGELTSLLSYLISGLMSLIMLVMVFMMLVMSVASGRRICQVLDETPDIVDPENPIREVTDGSIDFNQVQFSYPHSQVYADKEDSVPPNVGMTDEEKEYYKTLDKDAKKAYQKEFKERKKKEFEAYKEAKKAAKNGGLSEEKDEPVPVLYDIDLHIHSGETIGLIGSTGCGKSSFVSLISRLYDVTEGSVSVGGHNVKEYGLEELRDAVSVVLQKNVLFSGTILDNLRWGNPDATEEECRAACQLACADDFIQSFPDGYNTYIEQGGTNVSGGQKQRLCIARALLKNPKILILDDSTSAVDTATDASIRRSFRESLPDVTKIIVSQRISSIQDADRIIVMDKGRINGFASHEELLKTNTFYQELFETQQKGSGDFDEAN